MRKNTEKALKILTLFLSIFIGISGICLLASSLYIYFSGGDTPYSPEIVRKHILINLPLLIATALLSAAVFVIRELVKSKEKGEYIKSPKMLLDAVYLNKRVILTEEEYKTVSKGRKKAELFNVSTVILAIISLAVCLICSVRSSAYTIKDVNGSVINVVLLVFPLALLFAGALYTLYLLKDGVYTAEFNIVKNALKDKEREGGVPFAPSHNLLIKLNEKERRLILTVTRVIIPAVAICFIIIGISNGGAGDVLGKAVRICTECIGLG